MSGTHELLRKDLAALACGLGGRHAVTALRAAQHSKLLVTLRAILEYGPASVGPLADLDHAWDLLVAAERANPAAVDEVFALPAVHAWAAHALRRIRGSIDGLDPLWFVLGHLHAIAAAAAVRAGIDFAIGIPVFEGEAVLPTLGVLRSAGRSDVVVVTPETVRDSSWQPMHVLRCEHGGRVLSVWLDDMSPFRSFGDPTPPRRLAEETVATWRSALDQAWRLLVSRHPVHSEELAAGLSSLVPRWQRGRFRSTSATSADAFGSIEMAVHDDPAAMAVTLIHEFAHSKLNGLLELVELDREDRREAFYSPWRDDPRPLHGVLHGAYSFLAVADFWRTQDTGDSARFEFALRRAQTIDAIETINASGLLTDVGAYFVDAMRAHVLGWPEKSVADRVDQAVGRALADHRATWRLRHLVLDSEHLARTAQRWRAGLPWSGETGPQPTVRPDPDGSTEPRARTHLAQWALHDAQSFALLTARTVAAEVPGATPADLSLVRGDPAAAAAGYLDQIRADPNDYTAWIGFGLATGSSSLLDFPELVCAVYRAAGGEPADLVAWFDDA